MRNEIFLHPLSATREKISSAACPTPGCKGVGHVKGAKYSTHHSTFGCPYSLQNLNKDSCLVDRLSNNSMTEESDWSYASKQKLAVVKSIKGRVSSFGYGYYGPVTFQSTIKTTHIGNV